MKPFLPLLKGRESKDEALPPLIKGEGDQRMKPFLPFTKGRIKVGLLFPCILPLLKGGARFGEGGGVMISLF